MSLRFAFVTFTLASLVACAPANSDEATATVTAAQISDAGPDALAPQAVEVVSVACDKLGKVYAGQQKWVYAEHAFPGKSAADLSRVRVLFTDPTSANSLVPGYAQSVQNAGVFGIANVYVRDGSVAVICGATDADPAKDARRHTLELVLPK